MTDNPALEAKINEALQARHDGDLERARDLCFEALTRCGAGERKAEAFVYNELGYISRLLACDLDAETYLRKSILLAPTAELPSLQLFLLLFDDGRLEPALAEALRYVQNRDSSEYRALLSEGFKDDLDTACRELADAIRARLARWT